MVIDGRDMTLVPPHRRDVGMIFQSYALFPHLDVRRNVGYGLEVRRVARAEAERRIEEALNLVSLTELSDRYPSQLSGGQQQRVAIARVLVLEPTRRCANVEALPCMYLHVRSRYAIPPEPGMRSAAPAPPAACKGCRLSMRCPGSPSPRPWSSAAKGPRRRSRCRPQLRNGYRGIDVRLQGRRSAPRAFPGGIPHPPSGSNREGIVDAAIVTVNSALNSMQAGNFRDRRKPRSGAGDANARGLNRNRTCRTSAPAPGSLW